jgi:hypothetical protein
MTDRHTSLLHNRKDKLQNLNAVFILIVVLQAINVFFAFWHYFLTNDNGGYVLRRIRDSALFGIKFCKLFVLVAKNSIPLH